MYIYIYIYREREREREKEREGGFPSVSAVKNLPAMLGATGDVGSILELRRSPRGGHGNPLQYSCLENLHGQRRLVGYSV